MFESRVRMTRFSTVAPREGEHVSRADGGREGGPREGHRGGARRDRRRAGAVEGEPLRPQLGAVHVELHLGAVVGRDDVVPHVVRHGVGGAGARIGVGAVLRALDVKPLLGKAHRQAGSRERARGVRAHVAGRVALQIEAIPVAVPFVVEDSIRVAHQPAPWAVPAVRRVRTAVRRVDRDVVPHPGLQGDLVARDVHGAVLAGVDEVVGAVHQLVEVLRVADLPGDLLGNRIRVALPALAVVGVAR